MSSLETQLQERDAILDDLKFHLVQAQVYMQHHENKGRREGNFQEGDLVYLKLQPYRQQSLVKCSNEKLSPRFYGPYPLIQRIGTVAYKLQLPLGSRIHPIFHISQLKRALGARHKPTSLPAQLSADFVLEVEPWGALGVRNSQANMEVLIHWTGLQDFEATWEYFEEVNLRFLSFHLEDKMKLWVGGIARNQPKTDIRFTYGRRPKTKLPEDR